MPFVWTTKPSNIPFVCRNNPPIHISRIAGFTLVELMVTLVVVGILSTLAIPAMRTLIQNMRITSQANEFLADLNFTRSEAIKRATDVTLCKSDNPTDAAPACGAGTNWESGRIMFIDSNADGDYDSAETLLRAREPLEGGNTLTSSALSLIVYNRFGATTAAAVAFNLCDTRLAPFGRSITIAPTGRTLLSKPATGC